MLITSLLASIGMSSLLGATVWQTNNRLTATSLLSTRVLMGINGTIIHVCVSSVSSIHGLTVFG